jgi:putative endonuclease
MSYKRKSLGNAGEQLACDFLVDKGFKILERNYRVSVGEIDILAKDNDVLVIVEVKTKSNDHYGLAQDEVHLRKQTKLIQLAKYLMMENSDKQIRIDVVAINYVDGKPEISYIRDAVQDKTVF